MNRVNVDCRPRTAVDVAWEMVSRSLERIGERYSWGSVALDLPDAAAGSWLALADLAGRRTQDRLIRRFAQELDQADTQEVVLGNYLFRYALGAPLRAAGYLFVAERRVIALADNVMYRDVEWLQHACLLEPRLLVLPNDPLAGEPGVRVVPDLLALEGALFEEVDRAFGPLISAFRARRMVAVSNAWGSILDALAQGVLVAGKAALEAGEAWRRWNLAVSGRQFPLRRRPIRFSYEVDGERHEMAVRAGCCLYFMTPSAKRSGQPYCASCYLVKDPERLEIMTDYWRSVAAAKRQDTGSGND